MTTETQFRQRFHVRSETYWRELCLSLEYQERLYLEALGCRRMDVIELDGTYETRVKRRLRFEKPIDAPAPIKKVFGDAVTIEEVSEWSAEERRWSFRMIPAIMGDRIDIRGVVRLDESADGIEQISTNTVQCRMFGLGAVVEHFVAKSTNEGNADKAAFTRKYIAEKGLAGR